MKLLILYFLIRIRICLFSILCFQMPNCFGQIDSLMHQIQLPQKNKFQNYVFRSELIAPAGLLTYGIVSIKNPYIQKQNVLIRDNLQYRRPEKFPVDDYSQYFPAASFLALDMLGVSAKHGLRSRLYVAGISHLLMASTVNLMKGTISSYRPDFSADNSFPSGHTATAFVGAELVWQEYRHKSIWYGVGAYAIATGTGFFRMYNNKHWLSDVVMGAGIGILSAKTAYWLLPMIENRLERKKTPYLIYPAYNGQQVMLSFRYGM